MKKRIVCFLLVSILLVSLVPTAFAAGTEATDAANVLHELGLFNGTGTDENGNPIYDLDRAPSRAEAVTMLVRLLGKGDEAVNGTWDIPFTDVADWAKPYVGYAYANSLTSGTSATTFGGDVTVSATQYLTFILRALGYDSSTDFKWDAAWELSDELGFTSGEYNAETTTFLRGDVVKISLAALNAGLKNEDILLIQDLVSTGAVDAEAAVEQGFDIYGLTKNVHFIYDIRTFTLYAFMNYTGYDDNNGHPITGTRAALREDLAAMDIKISSPNYYTSKKAREYDYASALLYLGAAPDFKYYPGGNRSVSLLSDLPEKLKEFYIAADIPTLYEKYRADHETILNQYEQSLPDIVKMVCHFDAQNDVEGEFGLEVVLLDAWNRGSGLGVEDQYYGYGVIRTGPAAEVNTLNILHEYAHGFVNRAVNASQNQASTLSRYFKSNSNAVKKQGYDTWMKIVYESFVRAVSTYFDSGLTKNEKTRIQNKEMQDGFVMTQYIYDRIPEFETFDGDFDAFVKMLLVEYPQYA